MTGDRRRRRCTDSYSRAVLCHVSTLRWFPANWEEKHFGHSTHSQSLGWSDAGPYHLLHNITPGCLLTSGRSRHQQQHSLKITALVLGKACVWNMCWLVSRYGAVAAPETWLVPNSPGTQQHTSSLGLLSSNHGIIHRRHTRDRSYGGTVIRGPTRSRACQHNAMLSLLQDQRNCIWRLRSNKSHPAGRQTQSSHS